MPFFNDRNWKNKLVGAAASNLVSAATYGAQYNHLISPNLKRVPIALGTVAGTFVTTYAREGRLTFPEAPDMHLPTLMTFLNIALTELVLPFLEGDREKAAMYSAITLACICVSLAATITPATLLQTDREVLPPVNRVTFRERYETASNTLSQLIDKLETNPNFSTDLDTAKKLRDKMEKFEKQYSTFAYQLMNDPVTLPETGATYEREDIETYIRNNQKICPKTTKPLSTSLKEPITTNIELKNQIDNKLVKFENKINEIQKKYVVMEESRTAMSL